MRRREFITLLGLAASLPLAARAQKDGVRLVGMLSPVPEQDPGIVKYNAAFLDRLPRLARELVALKVDVIVAVAVAASLAAREARARIPIVMVHAGNPIGAGLIKSLSQPGVATSPA